IYHHLCTILILFFFNDPASTEIYTLSLHDALPIFRQSWRQTADARDALGDRQEVRPPRRPERQGQPAHAAAQFRNAPPGRRCRRSEEHTSELQSRGHLVCRLLLEKKKKDTEKYVKK